MEEEVMLLESMNSLLLDLHTIDELKEKGIKEVNFEWKFNFKNINLIPVLELYNKDKIYKTIEAIEFSELLQDLLRDSQILFNLTNKPLNLKESKDFLKYLIEDNIDCSKCNKRDTCFLRED